MRALFWPGVLLVAVAATVGYFVGIPTAAWQQLGLIGIGLVVITLGWLLPLCSWLACNYTITTRRIVLRNGVMVRTRQELLHSRGYDITVRQNSLQTMFGSGDVLINTGMEKPVVLRDVPSADLVQAALHDLMESSVNTGALRHRRESTDSGENGALGPR